MRRNQSMEIGPSDTPPVLYVRGDLWSHVASFPEEIRALTVRHWPGADMEDTSLDGVDFWNQFDNAVRTTSEWTHEREWRVRGAGDPPGLRFMWTDIALLLLPGPGAHKQMADQYAAYGEQYVRQFVDLPAVYIDAMSGEIADPTRVWIRRP